MQAWEILDSVRRQNTYIHFPTGETTYISFTPEQGKGELDVTVHEYDKTSGIPVELQPAIRMEVREAADKLWQVRKHYNAYWRQA